MEFGQKLAERARRDTQVQPQEVDFWKSIVQNLGNEEVIPIISGNIRLEQIFRNLPKESTVKNDGEGRQLTVVETLVRYWAQSIGYPKEDDYNLARVFQYELVRKLKELKDEKVTERDIDKITRHEIVDFLKNSLLTLASDDPDYLDVVEGLSNQMQELSFSEMARQLDYSRYDKTSDDPIRILARLPIKFFITSGQSDFIERALMAENKDPHTHVCFWSGDPSKVLKEHITAKDYRPTVEQPMVYHLFGLETYQAINRRIETWVARDAPELIHEHDEIERPPLAKATVHRPVDRLDAAWKRRWAGTLSGDGRDGCRRECNGRQDDERQPGGGDAGDRGLGTET